MARADDLSEMPDEQGAQTQRPLPIEARRALDILAGTLGDMIVGVYLFGSYCAGGLRPQSDIDVLVAVATPVTGATREALVAELLNVSGRNAAVGPSRPLEVTVVVVPQAVPWRFPPICDLLFGEWLRADLVAKRIPPPIASRKHGSCKAP